ncbi:LppP/LprE lipoprotein [Curtobacterium sp. PhB130]|uniref:LppP/LprE family lipoprotein n=1 Tax=unclassified Curtobacterium TaxID=257496 RepID=UPI000FAA598E|nr:MULTISPECIES: LppP/LprE family lipoprotein [unclassified Curtobacterium]ROP65241.1 LppP/LprE lipoprotein [Curtobacterium sp. ZW137]ROS78177.1 LppP/LprE lipoprotein [Curtobacterium sp. PhB130]TCK65504.1 LppP/LprE lipoprotein [Curtobacterium sp. PhB136]
MKTTHRTALALITAAFAVTVAGCTGGSSAADPTSSPTVTRTVTASPTTTPAPTQTPTPAPTSTCGPESAADAAAAAIRALPAPAGIEGATWDAARADHSGYDACAALSWSVVFPVDATGSSPYAILLFHDGTYLGTATKEQYAFEPQITRTDADTIAVTYRYPKASDPLADPTGTAQATFAWDEDTQRVQMTGAVPPAQS